MQLSRTQKSIAAWSGVALGLLCIMWLLKPVLAPFVIASVFAYALTPIVDFFDRLCRKRIPRVLWVVLVELVFLIALLGIALLVVPILAKQLPLMRDQLPVLFQRAVAALSPLLANWGVKVSLDTLSVEAMVNSYLDANFETLLSSLLASLKLGGSAAFSVIGNAILIPVALFYLLMSWDKWVTRLLSLVPKRMHVAVDSFIFDADAVLEQYLRGQLLVMFALAVYYSIGLSLFGLDLALPIGIFTGMAIFIPYLGFGIGLALAGLAGILQFSHGLDHTGIMLLVVYGGGQILEGFFLTPKLVGERIGLHPLAVIFALLAFGQLFGFMGVLIALPVSAVLLVAARRLKESYLHSPMYKNL